MKPSWMARGQLQAAWLWDTSSLGSLGLTLGLYVTEFCHLDFPRSVKHHMLQIKDRPSHRGSHLMFGKGTKLIQWGRRGGLFGKKSLGKLDIHT